MMPPPLIRLLRCVLVVLASVLAVQAVAANAHRPVVPLPSPAGGLQISLNTDGYRVLSGVMPMKTRAGASIIRPAREVITASVRITNRSGEDLAFTFPSDILAPAQRFQFRVFNAAGEQVWTSFNAGEPTVSTVPAVLRGRSQWSATVRVPLKPDGSWLPSGVYTLEASLAGTPTIGATTLFEIAEPPPPPETPKNTGIKGQVLREAGRYHMLDGRIMAPAVMPRGIPAKVEIEEIQTILPNVRLRAPFVWRGETTADGHFQASTPPGRFRVTVNALDQAVVVVNGTDEVSRPAVLIPQVPPQTRAIIETTVIEGEYTMERVILWGGSIFEQPRADTGIKGQFFLPAPSTQPQAQVAAGATVVVTELLTSVPGTTSLSLRRPFTWSGVTDSEGRFQVNTPPGRYKIAARWSKPPPPPGTVRPAVVLWDDVPMRGEFEATVTNGQIVDVSGTLRADLITQAQVIYSVEGVNLLNLTIDRSLSRPYPGTMVTARGTVSSGGWSLPQLRRRGVTEDGIVEYDFVAVPPRGPSPQVLTGVSASVSLLEPLNFRGVRVYSATNQVQTPVLRLPR